VLVRNPDTEVDSQGLSELIAKSAEGFGMVGGSLVFDDTPDKIINYGLRWSRMTGRVVAIGRNAPVGSAPSAEDLGRIDAVSDACVLATRAFVEDVGLMAEDYFLYMEDLDWGRRRGKHRVGFASKAVIRHIGERLSDLPLPPRSARISRSICLPATAYSMLGALLDGAGSAILESDCCSQRDICSKALVGPEESLSQVCWTVQKARQRGRMPRPGRNGSEITCSPPSHLPRSINLQRCEQKGP